MLWNEIKSNNMNSAEFITIFFKIFSEEQLLNLLIKLNGSNREQEKEIIQKDIEEGWTITNLEAIDPDPTFWNYQELCMIYLFEHYDIILRTNPKEGIAEFSS